MRLGSARPDEILVQVHAAGLEPDRLRDFRKERLSLSRVSASLHAGQRFGGSVWSKLEARDSLKAGRCVSPVSWKPGHRRSRRFGRGRRERRAQTAKSRICARAWIPMSDDVVAGAQEVRTQPGNRVQPRLKALRQGLEEPRGRDKDRIRLRHPIHEWPAATGLEIRVPPRLVHMVQKGEREARQAKKDEGGQSAASSSRSQEYTKGGLRSRTDPGRKHRPDEGGGQSSNRRGYNSRPTATGGPESASAVARRISRTQSAPRAHDRVINKIVRTAAEAPRDRANGRRRGG